MKFYEILKTMNDWNPYYYRKISFIELFITNLLRVSGFKYFLKEFFLSSVSHIYCDIRIKPLK